jgi:hypothetical protein
VHCNTSLPAFIAMCCSKTLHQNIEHFHISKEFVFKTILGLFLCFVWICETMFFISRFQVSLLWLIPEVKQPVSMYICTCILSLSIYKWACSFVLPDFSKYLSFLLNLFYFDKIKLLLSVEKWSQSMTFVSCPHIPSLTLVGENRNIEVLLDSASVSVKLVRLCLL